MDKYAAEAAALAEEAIESLNEAEIQALYERLSSVELHAWHRFLTDAAADIRSFARSTPAARRKAARWKQEFPVLVYATYLHYVKAHAMLAAVAQHYLTPGGSYRDTAVIAGDAYQTVMDTEGEHPLWPWGDDSPLEHWYQ